MAIARQNPIGTRAPQGARVVRVGAGKMTHLLTREGKLLCGSGDGTRKEAAALYLANAQFVTCYRCQKLLIGGEGATGLQQFWPQGKGGDRTSGDLRVFYPSNPDAPSTPTDPLREQYERFLHRQIHGGRREARATGGPYKNRPADDTNIDPTTGRTFEEISKGTLRRLINTRQPAGARTQSVLTRDYLTLRQPDKLFALTDAIRRSIDTYTGVTDGQLNDFLVPTVSVVLMRAGMPKKPAEILVQRAAGATFLRQPPPFLPTSIRSIIEQALGPLVVYVPKGVGGVAVKGKQTKEYGESCLRTLVAGEAVKGRTITRLRLVEGWHSGTMATQPWSPRDVFAESIAEQTTSEIGRQPETEAVVKASAQSVLDDLWDAIEKRQRERPAEQIEITFKEGDRSNGEVITLSLGEHSVFTKEGSPQLEVEYRSLRNVPLSELPAFLARISLRKHHEGRRLTPLPASPAKGNPAVYESDSAQQFAEILKAPGARPIPVPGKPGQVFVWSNRQKAVIMTSVGRAKAWANIAEAGRAARDILSETASAGFGSRQIAQSPAAEPRQITQSSYPEPKQITALENPMSFDDDYEDFLPYGYKFGAFGAGRPQPVNRRNPRALANALALTNTGAEGAEAMRLFHSKQAPSLKAAWKIVKQARRNPAKSGLYGAEKARWFGPSVPPRYSQFDQVDGAFGPVHPTPVNRRNPRRNPTVGPDAEAQDKAGRAAQARMPYFGAGMDFEPKWTKERAEHRAATGMARAKFPGTKCVNCGGVFAYGEVIVDSGKRGPKGGKKMKHPGC